MKPWTCIPLLLASCVLTAAAAHRAHPRVVLAGQLQAAQNADFHSGSALQEKGRAMLLEAGKSANGSSSFLFETYPGHFTQLTARARSGEGELHRQLNDVFFAVDGEATVVTGGHMVDAKDTAPGEVRGTRVEGGESHLMRKGDVLHISANTPHQTILAPGKSFVYFVVKVGAPPAHVVPAVQ